MSEILDLLQKLQGLGIGGLALLFLWITNKFWSRKDAEKDEAARQREQQIRSDFQSVIDRKDRVITELSDQLRQAAEQARSDMERHLARQAEQIGRSEATIATNTAAVSGLQDAVKELRATILGRG